MPDARENDWNSSIEADFRAHGGQITEGPLKGASLLLLTSTGARSGLPRLAPVGYHLDSGRYIVVGSNSGRDEQPSWLANVVKDPVVTVEVGAEKFRARAWIAEGAERRRLRRPTGLWTASGLAGLIHASIHEHGWPAAAVVPALLALAADPATKSPARLPCAGPWWESAETPATTAPADPELTALEARLAEADGARVALQRQARRELTAAGQTVTRLAVARRACALLDAAVGERS